MLYATASQALQVPLMILTGMLIGAVSLGFHAVRQLLCAGFWLSLICDIIMGLLWAVVFCAGVTIADSGRLRLFHVITAAVGTSIFYYAFSVPARRFCTSVQKRCILAAGSLSKNKVFRAVFR